MRGLLILVGMIICGVGCYRPASVNMRPDTFLNRSAAHASRQKDERWLVVLELPNPDGALNWGVSCDEQLDIQLTKAAPTTRAQWHVSKDRWEKGDPFDIRITTDNGVVVPVKISYSASVTQPLFDIAMSILLHSH